MRGSIINQVKQVWYILDQIGKSKASARNEKTNTAQNGHHVSPYVHSYQYKDEVIRTATDIANFARHTYSIKDMQAITAECLDAFIQNKIELGCVYRTISTYISHLEKILIALQKMPKNLPDHHKLFTRENLVDARNFAKDNAIRNKRENRAYKKPDDLRFFLKTDIALIAFDIQRQSGIRVAEATHITKKQLQIDCTIEIQGKGGYHQKICLPKNLFNTIKSTIDTLGVFSINYQDYRKQLLSASKQSNQKWFGIHGLRYNYAQEAYRRYQDEGYSRDEALQKVSNDLGHHRLEITKYYLH